MAGKHNRPEIQVDRRLFGRGAGDLALRAALQQGERDRWLDRTQVG